MRHNNQRDKFCASVSPHLNERDRVMSTQLLGDFSDVFGDRLDPSNITSHRINTGTHTPTKIDRDVYHTLIATSLKDRYKKCWKMALQHLALVLG